MNAAAATGSTRRVAAALAAAIWRFRGRALTALALLIVSKLALVGVPLLLKRVVDHFDSARSRH